MMSEHPKDRRVARRGRDGLTPMQRAVVGYLQAGVSDAEMARRLYVEPATIRGHISRLCALFAVSSRTMLVQRLAENRVARLESLIEMVLDGAAACPCPCCDQLYQRLYHAMQDDSLLD